MQVSKQSLVVCGGATVGGRGRVGTVAPSEPTTREGCDLALRALAAARAEGLRPLLSGRAAGWLRASSPPMPPAALRVSTVGGCALPVSSQTTVSR